MLAGIGVRPVAEYCFYVRQEAGESMRRPARHSCRPGRKSVFDASGSCSTTFASVARWGVGRVVKVQDADGKIGRQAFVPAANACRSLQ